MQAAPPEEDQILLFWENLEEKNWNIQEGLDRRDILFVEPLGLISFGVGI